jgi:hypothetical protein
MPAALLRLALSLLFSALEILVLLVFLSLFAAGITHRDL